MTAEGAAGEGRAGAENPDGAGGRSGRGSQPGTFASLAVRNFRLFFIGQFVSQVGNWLRMVGQTLLVLHLTGNGVAVGLLVACQFLPVLLIGAWAGLVADRSDKRRLLLIIQSTAMIQSIVLATLAFMDRPPLWALYAVALGGGFATAFDSPARRSFVVEMVPKRLVNNAVSLNSALMTSARVVGPALAGILVDTVGYGWCFVVDGTSYLAVLAALFLMRPAELRAAHPAIRAKGQIRQGLRYVVSVPELWIPLAMMTMIGTLAFNFQVVLPLFATRSLGGDPRMFTLLYSVLSIGSLMGALGTARRQRVTLRHVLWGALAFGVSMTALGRLAGLVGGVSVGHGAGRQQCGLHDRVDRAGADRGRGGHAGPGAGVAVDGVSGQHPHRRADPGGRVRVRRCPGGGGGRRRRCLGCGAVRPVGGDPPRTELARP